MSAEGQNGRGGDLFVQLVVCVALTGLLSYVGWLLYRDSMLGLYRDFRLGQLWVISFFDSSVNPVHRWLQTHGPDQMVLEHVELLAVDVGSRFRWATAALALGFAAYIHFLSPNGRLTERLNQERFLKVQARAFPILTPVLRYNPLKTCREPGTVPKKLVGSWQEALQPHEWLGYYQVPVQKGEVDRDVARERFAEQLGKPWAGTSQLAPHHKALLAAICLHGARRRDDARELIGEIAKCWWPRRGYRPSKLLALKIQKILSNEKLVAPVLEIAAQHYFVNTAFFALVKWARVRGGNFASAKFVWLRPVDRTLWYVFNDAGRRPAWTEAAGVVAHFDAEVAAGRSLNAKTASREISSPELIDLDATAIEVKAVPIATPSVDAAVAALQLWVTENKPVIPGGNRAWRAKAAPAAEPAT